MSCKLHNDIICSSSVYILCQLVKEKAAQGGSVKLGFSPPFLDFPQNDLRHKIVISKALQQPTNTALSSNIIIKLYIV